MDGRSAPRSRLARKLDVNVHSDLLDAIDKAVAREIPENPDISRSGWVRRELWRAVKRGVAS